MKEIASALVKAQKAFGPALKSSTNPHFRNRYADLSACIEAVIDGLNDNGIALVQKTFEHMDGVVIETVFIHESGESLEAGRLFVPASKGDAQGFGSALTYARRYSLMAACGIAPEDDDGNRASHPPKAPPKAKPVEAPKPPASIEGKGGDWNLKVTMDGSDSEEWVKIVMDATKIMIENTAQESDLFAIFRVNKNIYDKLKEISATEYEVLLALFTEAKGKFA